MKETILLVEDEVALAESLKLELEFEDYQVLTANDGLQALEVFQANATQISLIILDWMLPRLDGLGVLRRIRKDYQVPVIMLTARDYVGDKVAGLKGGADDYVTKPFDIEELLARIEVILRRLTSSTNLKTYRLGGLSLDEKSRQVVRDGQAILLTQREFQLLLELFKNQGEVCTRDELLDKVWGIDFDGQPNTVDVYIRLLRNKIDKNFDKKLLQTVRGLGYMLKG
ncbi:response regulator transcription factor [Ligilactobacillus equi]|uniref:Winged helix family two component transcriptional regulator n=2 Tax=Ligilactobacillus equi TaxID=137357 RepID=V7HUR8_9LACO|nr:response regulator transcription factor [Ligilactobacillus equi]ETA73647.1 winged helix family two component transcriptional regulator [Ligilactobacillus equi DPC 6820]KRL83184.1 winged helix family two component transcriptional regulator [Ligilactobacillus equi DSM 15833 = JCM 10991]